MRNIPKVPRSRLNRMLAGKCVKVREGLYRQLREREWIFNRMEDSLIFLVHKTRAYGVVVRAEDIDWRES